MHLNTKKHGISSLSLAFIYHGIKHTSPGVETSQGRSEQTYLNTQASKPMVFNQAY